MPALFEGSKRIALSRITSNIRALVDELLQELNTDDIGTGEWLMEGEITAYHTLERCKGTATYYVVTHHLDMNGDTGGGPLVYCSACEKVDADFADNDHCIHCGAA
jgi:hypothetical protein